MPIHRSTARNFSSTTENRIHSDDVAAQYGFTGGLVPGVAVFGHMTYPLVEALGEEWLRGYRAYVRLYKPAYDGDELAIEHTVSGDEHTVRCTARDVLLAEMHSSRRDTRAPGPIAPAREGGSAARSPRATMADRPEIHWDNVTVDEPFPAWEWVPDAVSNAEAAAQVEDGLPCYADGVVHPHAILSTANQTFIRRYYLPAWLHVSSEIRFHRLLRVGESVTVCTVPTAKWERKGHEFVDLRVLYLVGGEVTTEIVHTSIFKIAQRQDD